MGILKDMYSGKSGYFGENRIDTPEYIKCISRVSELEAELLNKYPDMSDLLNQFQNMLCEANSIAEYEMFAAGFRSGAQLMLEMLGTAE